MFYCIVKKFKFQSDFCSTNKILRSYDSVAPPCHNFTESYVNMKSEDLQYPIVSNSLKTMQQKESTLKVN